MSPELQALLAELAAAELACREWGKRANSIEDTLGRDSVDFFVAQRDGLAIVRRRSAVQDRLTEHALKWAAERAAAFVAASNETERTT